MSIFGNMNDPRRTTYNNSGPMSTQQNAQDQGLMNASGNTSSNGMQGSGQHGQNNTGTGAQAQAVMGQYGAGQYGPNSGNQGTMRNGGQSGSIVGYDRNGNPIYGMAGAPVNGQVGSPNLGSASELMRWASQVPGGAQYLQSIGMMPNMSSTNVSSGTRSGQGLQDPNNPWTGAQNISGTGGYGANTYRLSDGSLSNGPTSAPHNPQQQLGSPNPGASNPMSTPMSTTPGHNAVGGMMNTGPGGTTDVSAGRSGGGTAGDMSGSLQAQIEKLFQNPSGLDPTQQQQIVNEAQSPYAQQQQTDTANTQEDAIRRGASGSGGDSDIRDQLNRVSMEGASNQQNAATNARLGIQQQGMQNVMGALGAGNQLYGNQVNNANSIRQMQVLMNSLAQQNGPLAGLGMAMNMGGH